MPTHQRHQRLGHTPALLEHVGGFQHSTQKPAEAVVRSNDQLDVRAQVGEGGVKLAPRGAGAPLSFSRKTSPLPTACCLQGIGLEIRTLVIGGQTSVTHEHVRTGRQYRLTLDRNVHMISDRERMFLN